MAIIAEIYMNYTMEEAIQLAKKKKIKTARALQVYMDDTFGIIKQNKNKTEHSKFLESLNQTHPSFKFTSKIEDNKISFLVTLIIEEEDGSLSTTTYRKPSNTGLTNNSKSNQGPKTWTGILKKVLNKAYKLYSEPALLEE